jgi:hypothetical protein
MFNFKLDCSHTDTCTPDYFSGDHRPHLQIMVHNGMTLHEIKEALIAELSECVQGNLDWEITESDLFYQMAVNAINAMEPNDKNKTEFFTDLEEPEPELDDDGEYNDWEPSVYAFFIFTPNEE